MNSTGTTLPKTKSPARETSLPSHSQATAATDMAKRFEDVFEDAIASWQATVPGGVAQRLGGKRLFVLIANHEAPTLNRDAAAFWARNGLPTSFLTKWFAASGLDKKKHMYSALHVNPSTLSRAKPETPLDAAVTERVLRQSDLFLRAAEVFGSEGTTWMTKPHDLLDGKSPMEYAANEFGGAKVRQILNAIEYGGVV